MNDEQDEEFRLDKWLWAARFFKTRGLAAKAIEGGKVDVNGDRAKRSRRLKPGDQLRVQMGPYQHIIMVNALSNRRGPASEAATLYEETIASREAREALALRMKAAQTSFQYDKGKPNKKERRTISKFKDRDA
ncbi:MAG: S4 domain-containing protein [Gemmatimonadota bacterium]